MTHPIVNAVLSLHGYFSVRDVMHFCRLSESQIRDRLLELCVAGCVERHPFKRKILYKVKDRQRLLDMAEERRPMTKQSDVIKPDTTIELAKLLGYVRIPAAFAKPRLYEAKHNPDIEPRNFGPYCHSSIEYI